MQAFARIHEARSTVLLLEQYLTEVVDHMNKNHLHQRCRHGKRTEFKDRLHSGNSTTKKLYKISIKISTVNYE